MPKFLIKGSYTAEGLKGVQKDKGTGRQKDVAYVCETLGGKLDVIYFALGDDDVFAVVDMPGAPQVAALCLAIGASGMCKTSTVPLLTVAEMDSLLVQTVSYRPPGG